MLPPVEFGTYLSTGTKKKNKGQAIFFEADLNQIEHLIDKEKMILMIFNLSRKIQ
jgi:hypothetical protein